MRRRSRSIGTARLLDSADVTHVHTHDGGHVSSPRVRKVLAAFIAPFLVATAAGLLLLWPDDERNELFGGAGATPRQFDATVTDVRIGGCAPPPGQQSLRCSVVRARLDEGPDAGEAVSFNLTAGEGAAGLEVGDAILVSPGAESAGDVQYFFSDYQRRTPLVALALVFALLVVVSSRLRGAAALAGLGISLIVLIQFVLPAILAGENPLLVSIIGAAAIMFVTLYLSHGLNARTSTAVLGTLVSLGVTGALALIFVNVSHFTGFGSEEAVFLQVSAEQVNLQGLLLGGIVIGTLGVLDDVTVTQASAVWELHVANPRYHFRDLYQAAVRIGRDHIASTVNTLVLAYAGASLPLLLLFSLASRPLEQVLTGEVVAEEIVRTLVGSIGLVASVPLTTAIAAFVVTQDPASHGAAAESRDAEVSYEPPAAERAWREGS